MDSQTPEIKCEPPKTDCQTFKAELHKDAPEVDVICRSDDSRSYDEARKIRNSRFSYEPYCIVKCEKSSDVAKVVNFCRIQEKSVRIRSGGHQHEGMCSADDVVIIDLSKMNKILSPDVSTSGDPTIWIEPGAELEKIYKKLESQDYILPGGGCSTVNVGGLVQGGGWGMFARKCGLTCDALQEVELVLANGNIICASKDNEYSDLFWAIKGGGGGNFGVITKYKFNLMKSSKNVWLVVIRYSSSNRELLAKLLAFYLNKLKTFDHNITSSARVSPYDDDKKVARPTLKITFQCLGNDNTSYKAVDDFIQELKDIERDIERDLKRNFIFFKSFDYSPRLNVSKAFSLLNGVLPERSGAQQNNDEAEWLQGDLRSFTLQPLGKAITEGDPNTVTAASLSSTCANVFSPHKVSSAFPKRDTDTDINNLSQRIIDFIAEKGDFEKASAYLVIHSLGGEIKRQNQSSFFYRCKEFMLQFQIWWDEKLAPHPQDKYIEWIKDFRSDLDGADLIEGAFINFADRDLPVPENKEKELKEKELKDRLNLLKYYYGGNLTELRKIKAKYDPEDFFSFAMSIPPLPGGSNAKRE